MSDAWKVSDGQAVSDVMADLCEIYWLHVTPQNMNSHLSHFPGKQRCHCWEYTQQLLLHISGYHTLPSGGCSESCWQRAGPQLSKNYAPEALLIAVIFSYILLLCAVNSWLKCRIAFESPTLKCLESFFHHILGGREDHENTKTFLPPPWGVVHHKHVFFWPPVRTGATHTLALFFECCQNHKSLATSTLYVMSSFGTDVHYRRDCWGYHGFQTDRNFMRQTLEDWKLSCKRLSQLVGMWSYTNNPIFAIFSYNLPSN